jgi:hypothetical protein
MGGLNGLLSYLDLLQSPNAFRFRSRPLRENLGAYRRVQQSYGFVRPYELIVRDAGVSGMQHSGHDFDLYQRPARFLSDANA